ncbi:hypothetical protein D9613_008225 [Agrocybe pediades]|uniref:Uncharacterized protein n=1 Tax=Agrocybe pediades TaxID=84607 RepID=A0A8H4VQB2_9AGAR|nr:hypothetical protein D9613_008225 [Agrocybe pediades]
MVAFYIITNAIVAWPVITDGIQGHSTAISMGRGNVCVFPPFPADRSFSLFLPPIAFESGLCVMVLYKGYHTFRASSGKDRTLILMEILMRDSALYFLTVTDSLPVQAFYDLHGMLYRLVDPAYCVYNNTGRLGNFDELQPGVQDGLQPSRDRFEGADSLGKKRNTVRGL